jgi:rod shape-determining protein MreC
VKTLVMLIVVTVAVLILDLARPAWTEPVRAVTQTAFTPLQETVRGWGQDDLDRVRAERDRLAVEVERLRSRQDATVAADEVSPAGAPGLEAVGARVIAAAPQTSPVGRRVVTIDAGRADGVRSDRTVLNTDGLVGRVMRADESSAQVLVLGDPQVVVGVRFGRRAGDSALGAVSATPPAAVPRRGAGELTLTAAGDTPISVGDTVTTLGSPGDSPYTAGIEVGTVTAVDPDNGQLSGTAVVRPAVDTDTLDTVVVLIASEAP